MSYKYTIDKEAITNFFVSDPIPEESIKAAHMIITAVIIKHYARYIRIEEDLHSLCILKLLELRSRYDLSYSAYNYAYTACRNEIGNYINKHREIIVEDILPLSNSSVDPTVATLPAEINKFKAYLTGAKEFTYIELTEKEAVNLMCFCSIHQNFRKVTPPDFILKNPKSLLILYRLLLKL